MKLKSKSLKVTWQFLLVLCIIFFLSWFTCHSDLFNVAVNSLRVSNGDFSMVTKINGGTVYFSFFPPIFHLVDGLVSYPFVKLGIYNFDVLKYIGGSQLLSMAFLLKLRYLVIFIFSILVVKKLTKYFENGHKRWMILILWLLCPVLIFVPFSWGNNDIYPMFFSLFFLLFAFKKKNIWAMIFLGLSMSMKNYAIFLVLPAALILANMEIKKTIIYCFVSLIVYLIPYMFFYEVAHTFVTGGGEGLFIFQRNVLGGPLLFPLLYFLAILFLLLKQKITDDNRNEILVKFSFLILSLFYLTSLYIPQWFLWIMPFFVLTAYKDRRLFYLYIIICFAYFMGLFSWGRNLDTNLFAVAFPVINNLPTIAGISEKYFFDFKIFEIFNSLFFAGFIAYLYILFFDKERKGDLTEKEIRWFSLSPLFSYLLVSLVFVLGMNYIYKMKNREWYDLGLVSRNELTGPIVEQESFYQTFESPKDRLKGINIYFSTYGEKITSQYQLILFDENCKTEVKKVDIEVSKIEDNLYKEIIFDDIIDSENKKFCFTINPADSMVLTPVTLNFSQKDSYSQGKLFLNGKWSDSNDVVFQLIYPIK